MIPTGGPLRLIVVAYIGRGVIDHRGDALSSGRTGVYTLQNTLPAVILAGGTAGVGRVLQHVVNDHVFGGTRLCRLQTQLVIVGAAQIGDVLQHPGGGIALHEFGQAVLRRCQVVRLDSIGSVRGRTGAYGPVPVRITQGIIAIVTARYFVVFRVCTGSCGVSRFTMAAAHLLVISALVSHDVSGCLVRINVRIGAFTPERHSKA